MTLSPATSKTETIKETAIATQNLTKRYGAVADIPQVRLSPNQFPLSWPIEEYFFGSK